MTRKASCHPDQPHLARGLCSHCYHKLWNDAHKHPLTEAEKEARRAWYYCNRTKVLQSREKPENRARKNELRRNPEARRKARDYSRARRAANIVEYLVSGARKRCEEKGLAFDLDPKLLTLPDTCPLLGCPMVYKTTTTPSLDRIDPKGGYTRDNVWIISRRANVIKNDASLAEFTLIRNNWAGFVK